MAEDNTKKVTDKTEATSVPAVGVDAAAPAKREKKVFSFVGKDSNDRSKGGRGARGGGGGGARGRRGEKPRSDVAQSMISIRRVARVVSGGRRFSFSVTMIAGDRNGKVGLGMGKAGDTALAIDKALKQAKKRMITVNLTKGKSIAHEVEAKYASSTVFMKPAPGRGLNAGGSVRTVLDLAGIIDINAKILSRSKNRFNNAKAALLALSKLK